MPSLVYFKFKSNLTQQNIPFEGSAISVNDLKSAIRLKNGMKSNDFDLILMTTDGKDYTEKDLIPAYSSVIVRRMPVINFKPMNKTINPENFKRNDPYRFMRNDHGRNLKIINLATSDMTEDQKEDFVAEISSKIYNVPKRVQVGPVPPNYLCNKCNVPGHWIKDCPGIADKNGKMLESKLVKRPSGIPTTNLTEVDSDTPNSYLTSDGRYVVNTRNYEAYLKGKKDKRPFSQEENPPRSIEVDETPASLLCSLCQGIFRDPASTPCCGKVYCKRCAVNTIFDDQSDNFHRCPQCRQTLDVLDSLVDQVLLGNIIRQWQIRRVAEGHRPGPVASVACVVQEDEDDLTDDIFGFSDKENGAGTILLTTDSKESATAAAMTVEKTERAEHESRVIPVLGRGKDDGRRVLSGRDGRAARSMDRRNTGRGHRSRSRLARFARRRYSPVKRDRTVRDDRDCGRRQRDGRSSDQRVPSVKKEVRASGNDECGHTVTDAAVDHSHVTVTNGHCRHKETRRSKDGKEERRSKDQVTEKETRPIKIEAQVSECEETDKRTGSTKRRVTDGTTRSSKTHVTIPSRECEHRDTERHVVAKVDKTNEGVSRKKHCSEEARKKTDTDGQRIGDVKVSAKQKTEVRRDHKKERPTEKSDVTDKKKSIENGNVKATDGQHKCMVKDVCVDGTDGNARSSRTEEETKNGKVSVKEVKTDVKGLTKEVTIEDHKGVRKKSRHRSHSIGRAVKKEKRRRSSGDRGKDDIERRCLRKRRHRSESHEKAASDGIVAQVAKEDKDHSEMSKHGRSRSRHDKKRKKGRRSRSRKKKRKDRSRSRSRSKDGDRRRRRRKDRDDRSTSRHRKDDRKRRKRNDRSRSRSKDRRRGHSRDDRSRSRRKKDDRKRNKNDRSRSRSKNDERKRRKKSDKSRSPSTADDRRKRDRSRSHGKKEHRSRSEDRDDGRGRKRRRSGGKDCRRRRRRGRAAKKHRTTTRTARIKKRRRARKTRHHRS